LSTLDLVVGKMTSDIPMEEYDSESSLSSLNSGDLDEPGDSHSTNASSIAPEQCTYDDKLFFRRDEAPLRNQSSSWIWDHGTEYRSIEDLHGVKWWKCTHCKRPKLYRQDHGTKAVNRHLKGKHRIEPASTRQKAKKPRDTVTSLLFNLSVSKFRWLLIRWIVCCQIIFSVVQHPYFQELIDTICPSLQKHMVSSGNTIRSWIMKEYDQAKLQVRQQLKQARSRAHISFDCWNGKFGKPFVVVVAHYLDLNLRNRSVLLSLREIEGTHTGENLAEAIVPVLEEYDLADRLGFFIADNASNNDTCIRYILRALRPDIKDPDSRRVRCLAHVINLAAKAFFFGSDAESFESVADGYMSKGQMEELMAVWRRLGPIGKLHNTVIFTRASSQRRQRFGKIVAEADCKGMWVLLLVV
jgi:hypothetical protein